MDALILFSHGSLLCGSGEALEAHAERLRQRGDFSRVEVGYLNYTEPSFAEAVARVAAAGATRVTVAPYFLVTGYFVTTSLPREIEKAQAAHPQLTFTVAEALGQDEALANALLESAAGARGPEAWRDGLKRAALRCRPDPRCPLYGTENCPKVPVAPAREEDEGVVAARA
jgi:Uncharacterized conserved protein